MPQPSLTLRSLKARAVSLELERPVVAKIATITHWPLVLVDLATEEGIVGRSYLEPYAPQAIKYLVAALHDLGDLLKGREVSPVELYGLARRSLHFVGYAGLSAIAVSGLDMAAWDASAQAAGLPLCVLLGGTVGPVPAYNSNGLWLKHPAAVAAEAVEMRDAVGDLQLMVDYNQGLDLAGALRRCRMIDDHGLAWIEEPIVYDNLDGFARLGADLKTPLMIGENFYGPRDLMAALQRGACDLVMPDFMRIGGVTGWLRAAAIAGTAGIPVSTHLYPEVGAHVMRVTEGAHWLEWQSWADPILQHPYEVKDGLLHIPPVPGVGLEWDEGVVSANLVA